MSGKMGMSLDDIIEQNVKINPCTGGSSADSTRSSSPSTGSSRKGGAVRNTHKPGGDVLRSRNRVGISRNRSSSGFDGPTRLIIRKALLGLVEDRKFDIPAFSSRRTSSSDGGFERLGGRSFYDQAGDRSIDKDRAHPGNRPVSEGHGHPTNRPDAKSRGYPTNRPVAKGRGHPGKRDGASGKSAGGKAERGRQPKKTPTAEELDAELDEYMASVRTK